MTVRHLSAKAAIILTVVLTACGDPTQQVGSESAPELSSKEQALLSNKVLIYGPSVSSPTTAQEVVAAMNLGLTVEVASATTWSSKTAEQFATYRAIIFGDVGCTTSAGILTAAVNTKHIWGPAVKGNVLIAGAAPVAQMANHPLVRNAIKFATADAEKTGAYISLSCYYGGAPAGTPVPLLEQFGTFTVQGTTSTCWSATTMHKVAEHPSLSELGDTQLSGTCSAREVFNTFPAGSFTPVAIARDASDTNRLPSSSNYADGSHGAAYILARGVTPLGCGNGILDENEQCDASVEGSSAAGTCSATCRTAWCGNGTVEAGEACDEGAANGTGACSTFCRSSGMNRAPVAVCKTSLTLTTTATCGAYETIDNGSYDLDNNLTSCTVSPAGPWGPGTHTVTLTCRDSGNLASSCATAVTVSDTMAPTLSCPASKVVECTNGGGSGSAGQAVMQDNCSGSTMVTSTMDTFGMGTTTVPFTGTDSSGNTTSCTTTVTVQDTRGPEINLNGNWSQFLECAVDSYVEQGATATDLCYGDATGTLTVFGTVNTLVPGTYHISYNAQDINGLISTKYREVTVKDQLPPAITLEGPAPTQVECGGSYQEPVARAIDQCGGDLSSQVLKQGTVNPAVVGSYTVQYSVMDGAENHGFASRTVNVQDTQPPTLSCPTAKVIECAGGETVVDPGVAVATDACAMDSLTQHGPRAFPKGTSELTYTARDLAGHTASCSTQVTVADTLPPSIALNGSAAPVLECGVDSYFEAGAAATDVCAGDVSTQISVSGAVNTAATGTYPITYAAVDPSGNVQQLTRSVQVADTRAPALTLLGASSVRLECGIDSYVEPGARAADTCSGDVSAAISVNTGGLNNRVPGTYSVGYSVVDPSGNLASAARSVEVVDSFAPSLALAGSPAPVLECGVDTYVEAGAIATDACAGDVSSSVTATGTVNTLALGVYPISYVARDPSGHVSNAATRAVTVRDTRKPAVALNGPDRIQLECGVDTYAELGASATDSCQGNVSSSLAVDSSAVNRQIPGSYPVSYTASDASGNAETATRIVDVVDTLAPSIALNGAANVTLQCGSGQYADPGATAADSCSGNLTSSIVRTGSVDTTRAGQYTLSYNVNDGAGRAAPTKIRTVEVQGGETIITPKSTDFLWPPNHDYVSFSLADCVQSVQVACTNEVADINTVGRITSIASDEPEDAETGDGKTYNDIIITSNSSFSVRAERCGNRNGRVYTVNFYVADAAGNRTNHVCKFPVRETSSDGTPLDDGASAGYTVFAAAQ